MAAWLLLLETMPRIRRVLLPIVPAASWEIETASLKSILNRWGAELTLLHVVENPRWPRRPHETGRPLEELRHIARTRFPEMAVTSRVESGQPAEEIVRHVQDGGADLVVMAARHSSGLRRSAVGHVASKVVNEAPCAVWLHWGRHLAPAPARAHGVCCVADLNQPFEDVLHEAAEIADAIGATLTIIHVVSPAHGGYPALWDRGERRRAVRNAAAQLDAARREIAPTAGIAIEAGPPALLSRTIRNLEPEFLVSGPRLEHVLAAESLCPVWRVPARRIATAP